MGKDCKETDNERLFSVEEIHNDPCWSSTPGFTKKSRFVAVPKNGKLFKFCL